MDWREDLLELGPITACTLGNQAVDLPRIHAPWADDRAVQPLPCETNRSNSLGPVYAVLETPPEDQANSGQQGGLLLKRNIFKKRDGSIYGVGDLKVRLMCCCYDKQNVHALLSRRSGEVTDFTRKRSTTFEEEGRLAVCCWP